LAFEKEAYMPDEAVNIKAYIDNSQCSKALDKIVVKLVRHIDSHDNKWQFVHEDTLC
jgi:hypothetical protein